MVDTIREPSPKKRERLTGSDSIRCATHFSVNCPAEMMYLLVGGSDGNNKAVVQMDSVDQRRWGVTIGLQSGTYRYRFYSTSEGITTYVSPNDNNPNPVQMIGLDGIRTVQPYQRSQYVTS